MTPWAVISIGVNPSAQTAVFAKFDVTLGDKGGMRFNW